MSGQDWSSVRTEQTIELKKQHAAIHTQQPVETQALQEAMALYRCEQQQLWEIVAIHFAVHNAWR